MTVKPAEMSYYECVEMHINIVLRSEREYESLTDSAGLRANVPDVDALFVDLTGVGG